MKKLKYSIIYPVLFLLVSVMVGSCEKEVAEGYLSPQVRYKGTTYTVIQGRRFIGQGLELDASTVPFHVTLLKVTDVNSGEDVTELFTKTDSIYIYKEQLISSDTTKELMLSKLALEPWPALHVSEGVGELWFTENTWNVPVGLYSIDIHVKNAAGEYSIRDAIQFEIIEGSPVEELSGPYAYLRPVGNEQGTAVYLEEPVVTVKRIASKPNKVTLKYLDQNGNVFNPNVLNPRRSGDIFLGTIEDHLLNVTTTDSTVSGEFFLTPFPTRTMPSSGHNVYYRLPSDAFTIVGTPTGQGSSSYDPNIDYNLNPRFGIRIWQPGTYEITFQMNGVVRNE